MWVTKFLSFFGLRKPLIVRGWRTRDSATRISTPGRFGSWEALVEFRDRLLAAVRARRMKPAQYRKRLKRGYALYEYEVRMDARVCAASQERKQ